MLRKPQTGDSLQGQLEAARASFVEQVRDLQEAAANRQDDVQVRLAELEAENGQLTDVLTETRVLVAGVA